VTTVIRRAHLAIILAVAFITCAPAIASEPVQIRMSGVYYTAPATVRMIVAVAPDSRNRVLRVEGDGDEMFQSSEIALDGEQEARLYSIEFKNLSEGNYIVRAEVRARDGVIGHASAQMRVVE
jgi:hypothetical protein